MKQPAKIKCQCCQSIYEDDPLRQKEWWSGSAMVGNGYLVVDFHPDTQEHTCSILCRDRRIAQIVKPELKGVA